MGYRYLSDETLDSILPDWRGLLAVAGEVLETRCFVWRNLLAEWTAWVHAEKEKLKDLNMAWPAPWRDHGQNMGKATDKSQVMVRVTLRCSPKLAKTSPSVPFQPRRRPQRTSRTQRSGPRNRRRIRYAERRASRSESSRSSSALEAIDESEDECSNLI